MSPEDAERLAVLMRTDKVGGHFWGIAADVPIPSVLLCPKSADDAEGMATQALRHASPSDILTLFRDPATARLAQTQTSTRRCASVVGDFDPWTLLGSDTIVFAAPDDELALIACAMGARIATAHGGWRIESALALRANLARALSRCDYRDPFTAMPIDAERAIAILADWRRTIDVNRTITAVAGIRWWKREAVDRFLWAGDAGSPPRVRTAAAAVRSARRRAGSIAVWPSRAPAGLEARAAEADLSLTRIEDGFIRSAGLGVDLFPPFSIVVDPLGIYYDPRTRSALEEILEEADLPPALVERAAAIGTAIRDAGVSKYGGDEGLFAAPTTTKRRVLVTGQVEDDVSVRLGGAGLVGNLDLLARARAVEPDAEIWFRPHPDVDAGHRRGALADAQALRYADRIQRGGSIVSLLEQVEGIHVLTSLAGFEGLLRGRDVTTHGYPFYAGWGLTRDLAPPLARRTRRRTLDELVAATLILYPRYLDPVTALPCPPEILVDRLARNAPPKPALLNRVRRLQGRLRRALRVGLS